MGNHGGSSAEELATAMVFMDPKDSFGDALKGKPPSPRQANQIDLVPTLSVLFGIPIPNGNGGVVLEELFLSVGGKLLC
jgi:hypothetical protein